MTTANKLTKAEAKAQIVAAGRKSLAAWLSAAEEHGTIYYSIESVSRSGMQRTIKLATIIPRTTLERGKKVHRHELVALWPRLPDSFSQTHSDDLETVAKDWCNFSFDKRAFVVNGCGMDMVFHLIYSLAGLTRDVRSEPGKQLSALDFANKVRHEAF